MKKKLMSVVASAAIVVLTFTSCATINSGAALTEKAPIGQKVGEANSTIYLGIWSSNGKNNNIQKAAENGGITKVSQVEYIDKSVFFGFIIKHKTRVYGE
ncbi:MAG: TRL-like family protein [Prevotella sp.]|nr:TRL-like family protein [Prevotella sp.]